MARERAKLTDKQERILVQCQLMGLTTKDMTQISNRLVALEREARLRQEIGETTQGMSWTKIDKGWRITDSQGRIYDCRKGKPSKRHQSYWDRQVFVWNVEISGKDKRYKTKMVNEVSASIDYQITAKLCPENSKELYSLLRGIFNGKIS